MEQAQIEAREILYAHDPKGEEPYAGGFTIEKWEPGAFLELKANPYYFERGKEIQLWSDGAYKDSHGVEVGTPEGEPELTMTMGPHVESVIYSIYGSADAAVLAMKKGDIDFLFGFDQLERGLADQIRTDPNFEVVDNPSIGMRYMSFNNRRRPMNDCAFRQAVAVLIDKEFIADEILQGSVTPLYGYVPEANTLWYNEDISRLGENLTRAERTALAAAILKGAGYTWEGGGEPTWDEENRSVVPAGGLLMPDGTPVPDLTLLSPGPGYDPMRSTFAIWIENWLNEFGIPLEAELEGFNEMVPKIFIDQDFDMYILGWGLWETPDYLYDFFASEYAVIDGDNAGGYVNPDYDELAYQLLTCENFQDCKQISDQAQVVLTTELPYVILFDTGRTDAFRRDSVEYPYTDVLGGLLEEHGNGLMQSLVEVK
jgi:ABC-type transport system substrate-binding protein